MKRILGLIVGFLFVLALTLSAHADLILRGTDSLGNQLIYDTDLEITWYDYTKSADYWQNQVNWADALSVNFGGTIYDDWRLPITPGTTSGNTNEGEMVHLYYAELLNSSGGPLSTTFIDGLTGDTESLLNLQQDLFYWSGTLNGGLGTAWYFDFKEGSQGWEDYDFDYYALAVHRGDVASLPEPSTMFLLGSGLLGLWGLRKKLKR